MKSLTRLSPTDQLSIVMPVYNEESCISSVVNGLRDLMSDIEQLSGVRTSLIIVNDGSRDKTGAILDQIAKSDRRILVIQKRTVDMVTRCCSVTAKLSPRVPVGSFKLTRMINLI